MTNQDMSPQEYKVQRLKQNFANRVSEYEDRIATLETQLIILQQRLQQEEEDKVAKAQAIVEKDHKEALELADGDLEIEDEE